MTKTSKMPKRPRYPVPEQLLQPLPFWKVAPCVLAASIPKPRISASVGTYGAAHWRQTFRTRRCAIRARVDEATKKGFTPMSIKRVTALGASLVCRVENTKWPVREALMAMVFSTLHTNDAPSAVTRLIDIGVKPFLVAEWRTPSGRSGRH